MSWAEDYGYDGFDFDDFIDSQKHYMEMFWQSLIEDGCIWQDRYDRRYKPEEISDSHLLNVLNFCERSWRPEEQVEALKQLAKERGLI